MKKIAALVFVCTAVVSVPMAEAQTQGNPNTPSTSTRCIPPKVVYSERNWQDPTPVNGQVVCYAAGLRNVQRHFRLYREYRQIAPYRGYDGRGVWLTYLPIPRYIVDCESGGSWGAYNPSGATGPAQLLGWGAPSPARTAEQKVHYWKIAAMVWNGGSGRSNWVCA